MPSEDNTLHWSNSCPVWLRVKQICGPILPIGPSTWWDWVKQGKVPRGVKISNRITVWKLEDVLAVVEKYSSGDANND